MSICLWHRAIVAYIREVKIAAVKKAYESHSHESRVYSDNEFPVSVLLDFSICI